MNKLTQEDFAIFEKIEKIRDDIKQQNLKVEFLDFGAGNPEDNRDIDTMTQGVQTVKYTKELCQIGLKQKWAHLLYSLVKEKKPKVVLELGTCCGFSSIYMAKANEKSKIFTIEGACEVAEIASLNIEKANCNNIYQKSGKFKDVLPSLLPEISPINLAFIDGHHDKEATIEYYDMIKPYLSQNAIVVFDDISWSEGMKDCWDIIIQDADIKKHENLNKLGICYL